MLNAMLSNWQRSKFNFLIDQKKMWCDTPFFVLVFFLFF